MTVWLELLLQFVLAALGTLAFTIMFHVPRTYYPECGIVGAIGWIIEWSLNILGGLSPVIATVAAACFVTTASRICAVSRKTPATIFLLPTIFCLVPGIAVYRTIYCMIQNQIDQGFQYFRNAIGLAVAVVIGILLAFEIPQKAIVFLAKPFIRKK